MDAELKQECKSIIERIVKDSIYLAIDRWDLDSDAAMEVTHEAIVGDVVNVLIGDDTGCMDEADLSPDNCAELYLESKLQSLLDRDRLEAALVELRTVPIHVKGTDDGKARLYVLWRIEALEQQLAELESAKKRGGDEKG